MSDYSEFFLNGPIRVANLDTLEISHPSFSKTYWIVRNNRLGLTATLENGAVQVFEYYPVRIDKTNTDNTLDQIYKVSLGDLGEEVPKEIDRINAAGTRLIRPIVKYRTYRSDDLSKPLLGPMKLEIVDLPLSREGASFEAKAPTLNHMQTGEFYDLTRFRGLRSFV
jgi:hypothetical protein